MQILAKRFCQIFSIESAYDALFKNMIIFSLDIGFDHLHQSSVDEDSNCSQDGDQGAKNVLMLCMMTSSNGNFSALLALCAGNSPVTGEFPSHRLVTQSFDIFFDLSLNKRLN